VGELFDDPSRVAFRVAADLRVSSISEQPQGSDLSYGNEVAFRFAVTDQVSGQPVTPRGQANVHLLLEHRDEASDSTYTSASMAAEHVAGEYTIRWTVTPNAVAGPGRIVLVARSLDGTDQALVNADGQELAFDVEVGGAIDVDDQVYSTLNPDVSRSAVTAEFRLSCDGRPLVDAELLADLVHADSGSVVASGLATATRGASYQTSFTAKDVAEGGYELRFHRLTDKKRLAEATELYERQKRKAEALGEPVQAAEPPQLQPVFAIKLTHVGVGQSSLPVSPQFAVAAGLLATYVFLAMKRRAYAPRSASE